MSSPPQVLCNSIKHPSFEANRNRCPLMVFYPSSYNDNGVFGHSAYATMRGIQNSDFSVSLSPELENRLVVIPFTPRSAKKSGLSSW
jgi:hypothetical protein